VSYDTNLTPQDPNQVRAISVSRSGSKTFVKWNVLQENGKTLLVYFHQNGAEEPVLLAPQGLAPGATGYMILDQSMGSQCGHFNVTQATSSLTDETAPSANASLPPSGPLGAAVIFQVCDGDAPGSGGSGFPQPPTLLTNFHHRDHLGSLRVLTDVGGWKFDAHDYYPFGREIEAIQNDLNQGSVNRFTGHERDVRTGLDYMVMRSKSTNYPFFASADFIDAASPTAPHSWNKYAYVGGNPMARVDQFGLDFTQVCGWSDDGTCGGGGWGPGFWGGSYRSGGGFGGGGWGWGDLEWSPINEYGWWGSPDGWSSDWWGWGDWLNSGDSWNLGGTSDGGSSTSSGNADSDQPTSSDDGAFFGRCDEPWMGPAARADCERRRPTRDAGQWNGNIWGRYRRQDGYCSSLALLPLQPSPALAACCRVHDSCFAANQCNQSSWPVYLSNVIGPFFNNPLGFPSAMQLYTGCSECDAEAVSCVGQAGWQFFMGSGE